MYEDTGLGLTTWSPLASGLRTGKYRQGILAGSHGSKPNLSSQASSLASAVRPSCRQLHDRATQLLGEPCALALTPKPTPDVLACSRLTCGPVRPRYRRCIRPVY